MFSRWNSKIPRHLIQLWPPVAAPSLGARPQRPRSHPRRTGGNSAQPSPWPPSLVRNRPRWGRSSSCQWPFQEPIYWRYLPYIRPIFQALISGNIPTEYGLIWYSTSILGSWRSPIDPVVISWPFPLKPGIAQSEGSFPRAVQGWAPGFCAANGDLCTHFGGWSSIHTGIYICYIYIWYYLYICIYKYFISAITQHEESMIVGWPFPYAMFWPWQMWKG